MNNLEKLSVSAKAVFYFLNGWDPQILMVYHSNGFWILPGVRLTSLEAQFFDHSYENNDNILQSKLLF